MAYYIEQVPVKFEQKVASVMRSLQANTSDTIATLKLKQIELFHQALAVAGKINSAALFRQNFEATIDSQAAELKQTFNSDKEFTDLISDVHAVTLCGFAMTAKQVDNDTDTAVSLQRKAAGLAASKILYDEIMQLPLQSYKKNDKACFVCTAIYTSAEEQYKIQDFRNFRDNVLSKDKTGLLLIAIYYKYGIELAKIVKRVPVLRATSKRIINVVHIMISKNNS